MRKSFRGYKNLKKNQGKEFRVNEKIFAREVMVIDEAGNSLGVMTREKALEEARSREFDLIEVSPKNNPPVCRVMDYGSFKYQKEKQERKQKAKQKTTELKTVKISFRISQHDLEFRTNQAIGFVTDGDKVKIELQLKGRENQHTDLARELIKKMIEDVKSKVDKEVKVEQDIKKLGGRLSAVIY
ncbi:MAG: translation initiation factor IF-3 [Patescibacteria group bacterium]